MVYSATVTDGFIRDTEEVNARIFPTRIAIEQALAMFTLCRY